MCSQLLSSLVVLDNERGQAVTFPSPVHNETTQQGDDLTIVTRNTRRTIHRTRLRVQTITVIVALLSALPAAAIVYVMPTDESMVDRSPIIVFGEVLSAQPGSSGRSPATDYLFAVEEVLKGFVPGSGIIVRQPGGIGPGGVAMRVLGLPMLAEGDRALLFLDPSDGVYRPVEFALGLFFEVRAGDRVVLAREPSLRGEVPAPDEPSAAERARSRQPRDADRFRRWIADRAAGVERPADYFDADWPAIPQTIAEPFRLTRTPATCFHEGFPLRWREFDRGERIGVTVQATGQPGVPGGGLSEVRAAIRAWNDDPGSRVNLTLGGTSNRDFLIDEVDGVNSISYEDPFDEIPGSFRRGRGGTLAIAHTFFYCGASTTPHTVPGNNPVEALEIIESNITTQDGYGEWVSATSNPRKSHEEIMGHELGHLLGISHPCGDDASGPCDRVTVEALMRAYAHADARGAALNSDDRAAVRRLYPDESHSPAPDLVVEAPASTESSVVPGGAFRFAATVRNRGNDQSSATTLRYYRSSNSRITMSDTPVGADPIGALSASATDRQSIGQRAPSTPGTYYYGACVDSVAGESNTVNNCSSGVQVTVASPGPDLVVESPRSTESSVAPRGTLRFGATVRNQGLGQSLATTLRYYRSSDSTITTSDTAVGTDPIGALAGSATDRQSIGQRAPEAPGTYYYGACVDPVAGEADTTNNCSSGVQVTVSDGAGTAGFDLASDNNDARGIAYAQDRFQLVDWLDEEVYAYHAPDGRRDAAADFELASGSTWPEGITYAQGRFYVVDWLSEEVYAYRASDGRRDETADFDLASDNTWPEGITYVQGRFYVVDQSDYKVYAYRASDGQYDETADFELASDNTRPVGITYAQGRFYVVDWLDDKVYAYRASDGRRDETADFDLEGGNSNPSGITHAGDNLFVVDRSDDRVYAYPVASGSPGGDLVVESPRSTERAVAPGGTLRFGATVRNQGSSPSETTTLRYYRSTDSTITTSDTPVGTDPIGALSPSDTNRQSIGQRVPSSDGTYYYGACVDPVSGESDTSNNCSSGVRVTVGDGGPSGSDLIVESPRSTARSVAPGGTLRFGATVRNQGSGPSQDTTLRYYRSTDSTITTSDTPIGTDPIGALSPSGTDRQSIGQRVPSSDGTHYYGACVDPVPGESDTSNNCSSGARVTVGDGGLSRPDLIVEPPRSTESSVATGDAFRVGTTVRNQGIGPSEDTTLRYYRSADSTITTSDTPVGTDPVSALSPSATDRRSIDLQAPETPGTYYYGACVDSVFGESDAGNNCSGGVEITVSSGVIEYRYDDGTTDFYAPASDRIHLVEYAQRFRLPRNGTAEYVTLCVARRHAGSSDELEFNVNFYTNFGRRPNRELIGYRVSGPLARGTARCSRLNVPEGGLPLDSGYTWVGVSWRVSNGMVIAVDTRATGSTQVRVRLQETPGSRLTSWFAVDGLAVLFLRLGVNHGGSTAATAPASAGVFELEEILPTAASHHEGGFEQ